MFPECVPLLPHTRRFTLGPFLLVLNEQVRHPNCYGIDLPRQSDLLAFGLGEDEIAEAIGADAVVYQVVPLSSHPATPLKRTAGNDAADRSFVFSAVSLHNERFICLTSHLGLYSNQSLGIPASFLRIDTKLIDRVGPWSVCLNDGCRPRNALMHHPLPFVPRSTLRSLTQAYGAHVRNLVNRFDRRIRSVFPISEHGAL